MPTAKQTPINRWLKRAHFQTKRFLNGFSEITQLIDDGKRGFLFKRNGEQLTSYANINGEKGKKICLKSMSHPGLGD